LVDGVGEGVDDGVGDGVGAGLGTLAAKTPYAAGFFPASR
jgi:hypothetical protein